MSGNIYRTPLFRYLSPDTFLQYRILFMPLNYVDIALLAVAGIFSLRGLLLRLCGRSRGTGGVARRACSGPHVRPSMLGVHGTHAWDGAHLCSVGRPAAGRNGHYRPVGPSGTENSPYRLRRMARSSPGTRHRSDKRRHHRLRSGVCHPVVAPEHEFVKTSQVIPPLFEFVRWVAGSLNLNITLP